MVFTLILGYDVKRCRDEKVKKPTNFFTSGHSEPRTLDGEVTQVVRLFVYLLYNVYSKIILLI